MKTRLAPLVLVLTGLWGDALASPAAHRSDVVDTSIASPGDDRILRESIVIAAPREKVWTAFATTEGLRAWEAPVVTIDLKVGGFLEDSYDPKARIGDRNNIKNEILGFLPGELLILRNTQAPADFKYADLYGRVTTIIQFEDAGPGRTRLIISGVGFGAGSGFDALYAFFHAGNAYELKLLKAHLEGGPPPAE